MLILRGDFDSIKEIMEKSQNIGMKTFDSALFDLYQEGMEIRPTHRLLLWEQGDAAPFLTQLSSE